MYNRVLILMKICGLIALTTPFILFLLDILTNFYLALFIALTSFFMIWIIKEKYLEGYVIISVSELEENYPDNIRTHARF